MVDLDDLPAAESLSSIDARAHIPVEDAPADISGTFTLIGGTVMTATGEVWAPGWLTVEDGRIAALGEGDAPNPVGSVIDVTGRTVTPGLIDTHSHMGVYASPGAKAHGDGNEVSAPVTAGVWAEHSVWPQDPNFQRAVAGGTTTVQIIPGSANLIGGRGVTMHLVPTRGSRSMRLEGAPDGLKMACGENPKRVYGEGKGAPSTRMGNVRGHRAAYAEATEYRAQWEAYTEKHARWEASGDGDEPDAPKRDLKLETLVGVLEGEILVHVHCYRADDMLSMLQIAEEFDFEVRSFHHAVEAYKIADVLAENQVSVSTWADWWGFKMEAYDGIPTNLAMNEAAGGRPIVHSDSAIDVQRLNQEAAKGMRHGWEAGIEITEDQALRWITANPAWALGIDEQVGSLETGKRADLVVWNSSPFSVYAQADLVFIDGVLRHDRDRPGEAWSDFEVGQDIELSREGVE
ncbi:MAG: amidohydrolase [Proteobacteria bacterium]|nr:amidohydrolase [Pseudomonadota bacterium]MCP4917642.1 amidohydrolase [Pseudomonadota bacterium]